MHARSLAGCDLAAGVRTIAIAAVIAAVIAATGAARGQDGPIFPGPVAAVGNAPLSVAVQDLNGDAIPDLAVANYGSDSVSVSVLIGTGDASFAPEQEFVVGASPQSIAIGDVDGDGNADPVVSNLGASTISVLFGAGDGTFAPATQVNGGSAARSFAIGDLNGDDILDIVIVNEAVFSFPSVSILIGNGNGTFQPQQQYGVGISPRSVAIQDLNGDGIVDLSDLLSLLSNWGACAAPPAECPGDLDESGTVDLVDLLILLGNWS